MNKQSSTLLLAIGLSAVMGSTRMMAQEMKETATIPFGFQTQGLHLASGVYVASRMYADGRLLLRNNETGNTIMINAYVPKYGKLGESKLVFRRYGNKCFLAEVWFGDSARGYTMPTSKLEKEARLAMNNAKPEVIYLAAR